KKGARAGAIIGALIGVLGGPVGMAAGAAAGGGGGYLTGNAVGIPREKINEIKDSMPPGSSAILAIVEERWAAGLKTSLKAADAKQVRDYKTATPSGAQAPSDTQAPPPPADGTQPQQP